MSEKERLLKLTLLKQDISKDEGVLIVVYRNASGFLYSLEMSDGGTDLGHSEFTGNCKNSGSFLSYTDALQDAVGLLQKYPLKKFEKLRKRRMEHWGNFFSVASKSTPKADNTIYPVDYSSVEDEFYTTPQVIDLLVIERERAVKIAYAAYEDKLKEYDSKVKAEKEVRGADWEKNSLAFIKKEIADEIRLVGNAISGGNALSEALGETMKNRIEKEFKNNRQK